MADLDALQADPKFRALPPERQQLLLSRMNGPRPLAAPAQQQPSTMQRAYSAVAEPATRAATHLISGAAQQVEHPEWSLKQGLQAAEQNYYTPAEKLPPLAREVAEFVVPQTPTAAAVTAGSLLLPEVGAARVLGEAAGPVARMAGSRFGRMAALTGIGAATGAATGEGALKGAGQGALSSVPAESLMAAASPITRRLGEAGVIRDTTAKFGKAISARLPWIGQIEKGSDFADAFIHGRAVERAGNLLQSVKNTLGRKVQGYHFQLPAPDPQTGAIVKKGMGFVEADKLITELQRGYGFTLAGAERAGPNAREARALAYEIRDRLADGLNQVQSGLGNAYLKARKQFDAAKTLTDMFDKRELIGPQGLNQPKLIDRMNEYSMDLDRAIGKGASKSLMDVLRRGFVGEGKDIPGVKAHTVMSGPHIFPPFFWAHRTGGQAFDPVGQVGGGIRPSAAPLEALISQEVGRIMKGDTAPKRSALVDTARQKRAENIAGPKATATKVDKVKTIDSDVRSGKTPDVHKDLSSGRISSSNVRKMLDGGKPELASVFDGLTPEQSIDTLAKATPSERELYLPIIAQKIQSEGSKLPRQQQQQLIAQLRSAMTGGGVQV